MATLASALGYDLPADAAEDSHDLLPLLKGEAAAGRTTHIHNTSPDRHAIGHGDWLLIDCPN
jgi:arylsulfatase A